MCFMIAITAYCQQECVKIVLFAGSEEPTDVIILNNNKKLNLTMAVTFGIMLDRGFFAQPCGQNSNCFSSVTVFCHLIMLILNTVNKLQ